MIFPSKSVHKEPGKEVVGKIPVRNCPEKDFLLLAVHLQESPFWQQGPD